MKSSNHKRGRSNSSFTCKSSWDGEIGAAIEAICETLSNVAGCGIFDPSVFDAGDAEAAARLLLQVGRPRASLGVRSNNRRRLI